MPSITRRIRSTLTSDALAARVRQILSDRIASDAFDTTKVALKVIQASADACAPLKSGVSAALVLLEMSEKIKSNKKEFEHLAERATQIVQDIWRQTKDFNVVLPAEVERSVVEIEMLFRQIENFFNELDTENVWQRLARQDRHKSQVEEYGRLLDEAMSQFSINLQFSIHRLHVESAAAARKEHAAAQQEHAAVLSASQMSEAERLQLLTRIHGKVVPVHVSSIFDANPGEVRLGKLAALGIIFFLDQTANTPFQPDVRR
ncbi:hypothetical protein DFH08DRAFT_939574 [Mycena albidolilacea]|uniref:Uncharacterized protein n=1 Tax=Mycena albidolilacea TaxID=1033008 RepID=A0AAD6ZR02_9AGAR|nr:hypothetical protein DFH08DRAFT_939574 [Mycena albidolilacea]